MKLVDNINDEIIAIKRIKFMNNNLIVVDTFDSNSCYIFSFENNVDIKEFKEDILRENTINTDDVRIKLLQSGRSSYVKLY